MKKTFGFTLGIIFAVVILLSFARADIISNPTSLSLAGNEGSNASIGFILENTNETYAFENMTYTFTNLVNGSQVVFSSMLSLEGAPEKIVESANSAEITLKVEIPESQLPGEYEGNLTISGKYNGTSQSYVVPIKLSIAKRASLKVNSVEVDANGSSFEVVVKNDGNVQLTNVILTIGEISGVEYSYDNAPFNLEPGQSRTINVDFLNSNSALQSLSTTLTVSSDETTKKQATLKFKAKTFCSAGERGELVIDKVTFLNKGDGDDTEWDKLDDVEVKVEVLNDGEDSVSNVKMKILILDEAGHDVTKEFTREDITRLGKIRSGESESDTFKLKVGPEQAEGTYRLYLKAYKYEDEEDYCVDKSDDLSDEEYHEFDVVVNSEVAIDDLRMGEQISCGSPVSVQFDFYNFDLGDSEKMRVHLVNSQLGLDLYSEAFTLDEGEHETLNFEFNIPNNAEEKDYDVQVIAEYDYDEDTDTYDRVSKDAGSFVLNVGPGSCIADIIPVISATLDSEKINAGSEIQITASITNNHSVDAFYSLSLKGEDAFAGDVTILPPAQIVKAGETKQFIIKMKLNEDSQGEQMFNLVVSNNGREVATQPVMFTVENNSFNLKQRIADWDWKTIRIAALNIILVILIIVIAIKIIKRK